MAFDEVATSAMADDGTKPSASTLVELGFLAMFSRSAIARAWSATSVAVSASDKLGGYYILGGDANG